jgi:type III pantothenate kinase
VLLAVDVGNTQTVIGLYDGDQLADHWRIATNPERTSDEHHLLVAQFLTQYGRSDPFGPSVEGAARHLTGMVVASVVPRVTAALREMARRYLGAEPVVVEPGVRTGLPILYDNPREVWADRIANAVGAHDLYGGPAIVVDFGTATTLDAITAAGEYAGGAIVPGVEVSLDALFHRADRLTRVELVEPRGVIGKNTVESVQSGVLYGTACLVEGLTRRFQDELGPATVVATGGLGGLFAALSAAIDHHEPWLTLHGLRLIHARNAAPAAKR